MLTRKFISQLTKNVLLNKHSTSSIKKPLLTQFRSFSNLDNDQEQSLLPLYGKKKWLSSLPKKMPHSPLEPEIVYQLIRNELMIDANPEQNLASFCNQSYADNFATRLFTDNMKKNFIDHSQYPKLNYAGQRSIWMLATELGTKFDNADIDPDSAKGFYGTPTIGSSEAVMLGLIAHKYKWNVNNKKLLRTGKADAQDRPIVLMSAHVHGCWDKFCRYFDAVPLYINLEEGQYTIGGDEVTSILNTKIEDINSPYAKTVRDNIGFLKNQGDRTIGELVMCVGAVAGTTFSGNCDDVLNIDKAVSKYCKHAPKDLNIDIPIHVDAAASGFVLMFSKNGKERPFDFRNTERVQSINISNHKFGMTFPGMGSVVFRNSSVVDSSLIYNIKYLGGNFSDYTVNFSRASSSIVMQYYNFLRFGREGYAAIMNNCITNTNYFIKQLSQNSVLNKVLKNISDAEHLPMIVLTWADKSKKPSNWDLRNISDILKESNWVVPSYVLPKTSPEESLPPSEGTQVLRLVIQQNNTRDKLDNLLIDLEAAVKRLNNNLTAKNKTNDSDSYDYLTSKMPRKGYSC